jgi:hypothetical protein
MIALTSLTKIKYWARPRSSTYVCSLRWAPTIKYNEVHRCSHPVKAHHSFSSVHYIRKSAQFNIHHAQGQTVKHETKFHHRAQQSPYLHKMSINYSMCMQRRDMESCFTIYTYETTRTQYLQRVLYMRYKSILSISPIRKPAVDGIIF